jgi:hypothetical protein
MSLIGPGDPGARSFKGRDIGNGMCGARPLEGLVPVC